MAASSEAFGAARQGRQITLVGPIDGADRIVNSDLHDGHDPAQSGRTELLAGVVQAMVDRGRLVGDRIPAKDRIVGDTNRSGIGSDGDRGK